MKPLFGHDDAVAAFRAGLDSGRLHHAWLITGPEGVGKASFGEQAIADNIRAVIDSVVRARPTGAKGTYLKKISISSTMGPGVKVALASVGQAEAH